MNQNNFDKFCRVIVKAQRPVAYLSPDHLMPWGTRRDNSKNRRFNEKLYALYQQQRRQLKILDLGCAGGGFVKDCLDDGCLAIGLEGSDYSRKYCRAEWASIPNFLFTCDITGDFDIFVESTDGSGRLIFDVVTAWEVMEHIAEADLSKLAANVYKHLSPGGLWIMSISPNEEVINGIKLHQTVKPKSWWVEKFKQLGFEHLEEYVRYFNGQFIRGPKYWAPNSFHLVVSYDKTQAPNIPSQRLIGRIYDHWLGSSIQRALKKIIVGN